MGFNLTWITNYVVTNDMDSSARRCNITYLPSREMGKAWTLVLVYMSQHIFPKSIYVRHYKKTFSTLWRDR